MRGEGHALECERGWVYLSSGSPAHLGVAGEPRFEREGLDVPYPRKIAALLRLRKVPVAKPKSCATENGSPEHQHAAGISAAIGKVSGAGALVFGAFIFFAILQELTHPPFAVEIESAPEDLAKSGLPKEAIAGLLRDEIRTLIDAANTKNSEANLELSGDQQPEISIAGAHLSARAIAKFIRDFVGLPATELSGSVVAANVLAPDSAGTPVLLDFN